MIKVSIITVCLNSEEHIEQTIKSVLNQTYKDIEYIIIDGLSTDRTLDIIEKYKKGFGDRLKIISEKDNGIYDAMNKGIRCASGELIGIINSDDWYEKDTVSNVVNCYTKNKNSVIYGALLFWKNNEISKIETRTHLELWNGMIAHPTVFVPKNLYMKYGGFNTEFKIAADYDMMLRLYNANVPFKFTPKILANFRDGGASTIYEKLCHEESLKIKRKYGYKEDNYCILPEKNRQSAYFWRKLLDRMKKNNYSNVYLYGSGVHTKELIKYIVKNSDINIEGIIDREVKGDNIEKYSYKLININQISDNVDAIVISSGSFEYEIYSRIKHLENKIDIIRIYGTNSVSEANELIANFNLN